MSECAHKQGRWAKSVLSRMQDRELVSIRDFLAQKSKDGKISTLLELEAFMRAGGLRLFCGPLHVSLSLRA